MRSESGSWGDDSLKRLQRITLQTAMTKKGRFFQEKIGWHHQYSVAAPGDTNPSAASCDVCVANKNCRLKWTYNNSFKRRRKNLIVTIDKRGINCVINLQFERLYIVDVLLGRLLCVFVIRLSTFNWRRHRQPLWWCHFALWCTLCTWMSAPLAVQSIFMELIKISIIDTTYVSLRWTTCQ